MAVSRLHDGSLAVQHLLQNLHPTRVPLKSLQWGVSEVSAGVWTMCRSSARSCSLSRSWVPGCSAHQICGVKAVSWKVGEDSAFPRVTAALWFPGCVGKEEGWWWGWDLGEQQQSEVTSALLGAKLWDVKFVRPVWEVPLPNYVVKTRADGVKDFI